MSPAASPVDRRKERRRARFRGLHGACVLATMALLTAACSLDWTVRSDPGIAPGAEAGVDGTTPGDGSTPGDSSALDSQTTDAPVADAASCATLQTSIVVPRSKARTCTLVGQGCKTTVTDECGCKIVVADNTSSDAVDFANAVTAFLASCKPLACPTCQSSTVNQASWTCVQTGAFLSCFP